MSEAQPPSGFQAIVPYKNMPGLLAYYCGVFSLIPCVALLLGPAAVVLGIFGLKRAAEHPEARGKGHAWAGIILGGLTFLANAVPIVFMLIRAGRG